MFLCHSHMSAARERPACPLSLKIECIAFNGVHAQVLGLTSNVRKMFRDMDEGLYEECRLRYEAEEVRIIILPAFVSAGRLCTCQLYIE